MCLPECPLPETGWSGWWPLECHAWGFPLPHKEQAEVCWVTPGRTRHLPESRAWGCLGPCDQSSHQLLVGQTAFHISHQTQQQVHQVSD